MSYPLVGPLGVLSATGNMLYRDASGNVTEVNTATATDGQVLTRVGGVPAWAAVPGAIISFGSNSVAAGTATRYLDPWFDDALAQTLAVQWRCPRPGTLRNMYMRQNVPLGNGNPIVYALRINSVATALTVSMASTATDGSDLVSAVAVAQGDLVDLEVTKAAGVGTSPNDIICTMELAA